MSSIKFTLWIIWIGIWIGILLSIGFIILFPMVILIALMTPLILLGLIIA